MAVITYNYIADLVKQFCKTNSANCPNLHTPNEYRSGASHAQGITFGTYCTLKITRTVTNSIAAVAEITIENEVNSFLTDTLRMNATQLNTEVNEKNFMNFICNLAIFVTTKMCYTTSEVLTGFDGNHNTNPSGSNSTMVYISANKTFNGLRPIDTASIDRGENTLTLTASEVVLQLQSFINTINRASDRTVSNKINFSIQVV